MLVVYVAIILIVRVPFVGNENKIWRRRGRKLALYTCASGLSTVAEAKVWNTQRYRPPYMCQSFLPSLEYSASLDCPDPPSCNVEKKKKYCILCYRWVKNPELELEDQLPFFTDEKYHTQLLKPCHLLSCQTWAVVGPSMDWSVSSAQHSSEGTEGSFKLQSQPVILKLLYCWTFCPLRRRLL